MFNKLNTYHLLIGFFLLQFTVAHSQIFTSGFYPKKNKVTFAPSYTSKSYDKFYRGTVKNEGNPGNFGEIEADIINLFLEYGITDRISIDVSLPYIQVDGGNAIDPVLKVSSISGWQDLNIYLKGKIADFDTGYGSLNIGAAGGIAFPLSDYEGGGVISLGNESTNLNSDLLLHYETPFKLFVEAQAGYSYRISNKFDIPDAYTYAFKLGYFNKYFYVHSEIDFQDSDGGFDIGSPEFIEAGEAAALPETEIDYTTLTFSAYVPVYKQHIGVSGGYTFTVDGRNFSKEEGFNIGLVFKN